MSNPNSVCNRYRFQWHKIKCRPLKSYIGHTEEIEFMGNI